MSWQRKANHLRRRVQMRLPLSDEDYDSIDEVVAEAQLARSALSKMVAGAGYWSPSRPESDGSTCVSYDGGTCFTPAEWTMVETLTGDL